MRELGMHHAGRAAAGRPRRSWPAYGRARSTSSRRRRSPRCVGFSTLGDFIFQRNVYGSDGVTAGAICVALLALLVELTLAGVQRLLTPRGLKLQRRGSRGIGSRLPGYRWRISREGRGSSVFESTSRLRIVLALAVAVSAAILVAACGSSDNSNDTAGGNPSAPSGLIKSDPSNGERDADGRLEELHRGVRARPDLRPGARGGRLRRQDAAQPRLGDDRAQGASGRSDLGLPGVHVDRARVVLRRASRRMSRRRERGVQAGQEGPREAGSDGLPAGPVLERRTRSAP